MKSRQMMLSRIALAMVCTCFFGCLSKQEQRSQATYFEASPADAVKACIYTASGDSLPSSTNHEMPLSVPLPDHYVKGFRELSLDQYLNGLTSNSGPALLEGRRGIAVVLDTALVDGVVLLQLVGTAGDCNLLPKEAIARWEISRVLEPKLKPSSTMPIPVQVGAGELTFEKLWHNCGLVKPFQRVPASFEITNTGPTAVIVESLRTSCGCLIAHIGGNPVIEPGNVMRLEAIAEFGKEASFAQTATLSLVERGTGMSRRVVLPVYGSEMASGLIVGSLDFGMWSTDRPNDIERTIRLSEVHADKFSVEDVICESESLRYKLETSVDAHGLKNYLLKFTLSASELTPGEHLWKITVRTDSRHIPVIPLNAKVIVRAPHDTLPTAVTFGTVGIGQSVTKQIPLVDAKNKPLDVAVVSSPTNLLARVVTLPGGERTLIIEGLFTMAGIYSEDIVVTCGKEADRRKTIRCVAHVSHVEMED